MTGHADDHNPAPGPDQPDVEINASVALSSTDQWARARHVQVLALDRAWRTAAGRLVGVYSPVAIAHPPTMCDHLDSICLTCLTAWTEDNLVALFDHGAAGARAGCRCPRCKTYLTTGGDLTDDRTYRAVVGHRVRERRILLALSQEEVATRADAKRFWVGAIENATLVSLDATRLRHLADALGLSLRNLLAEPTIDELPDPGRRARCPYPDCGFTGTDDEVDDHRTAAHRDEPQAGSDR